MDHPAEVKFGDLQVDERYKKLERSLKLASLKKGIRKGPGETWSTVTSPSVSSINVDAFDSSCTVPLLQTSRIGSEVVSSSNNLRNILLKKKDICIDHKTMATSSVKQYSTKASNPEDRLIMPPPNFDSVPRNFRKSTKITHPSFHAGNEPNAIASCPSSMVDKISDANVNRECGVEAVLSEITSNDFENRKIRVFSRWRIMLNEQGQLIIKGTLDCGKVARSKPVIRRLTSTSVESIFKHLYRLQGSIVDDRNELPEYVRGKFYNGFPDDWENVYQIWRAFIRQGCALTFRWPTPITDSDDDLKSEITDITISYSKTDKSKVSDSPPFNESSTTRVRNPLCSTSNSRGKNDSAYDFDIRTKTDQDTSNKENYEQNENFDVNQTYTPKKSNKLKDILKEDKLNIIINNLADKNCPSEYINKIIEMFDCLNYVVSYKTAGDEECDGRESRIAHGNPEIQERSIETVNTSQACFAASNEIPFQKNCNPTEIKFENSINPLKKTSFVEEEKAIDDSSDKSESETYTGIPKISAGHVLRQKGLSSKPKRKVRKKTLYSKCENSHTPVAISNRQRTSPKETAKTRFDDSSVSITEDEIQFSQAKKNINSLLPHMESRIWQEDGSQVRSGFRNRFTKFTQSGASISVPDTPQATHSFNTHLIQKDSKQIDESKDSNSSIISDSEDNDKPKNGDNDRTVETRPQKKTLPEISKALKPAVISSVPMDININFINKESKSRCDYDSDVSMIQNENKKIKDTAELTRIEKPFKKVSPSKKAMFTKNVSLPEDSGKQPLVTNKRTHSNNAESATSNKTTQSQAENLKNQNTEINCNPKLLSAWIPRVACDSESNSELGLIFEGKLLNEAGHVVHRKFTTGIVRRRISRMLIETKNHEFYQLVGDLNDTKHVVPKELLNQCRYGCPSRMEKFCRMWQSLRADDVIKFSDKPDTSMDSLNVPMSSKGRRILPPLSYWTGERVALKDNNLVYSPGTAQESLINSLQESPKKNVEKNKRQESQLKSTSKQGKNTSRKSNSDKSQTSAGANQDKSSSVEMSVPCGKTTTQKLAENSKKLDGNTHSKSASKHKRKVTRKQLFTSSDSSDEKSPARKMKRVDGNHKEPYKALDMSNKGTNQSTDTRNSCTHGKHSSPSIMRTNTKRKNSRRTGDSGLNSTSPVDYPELMSSGYQSTLGKYKDNIVCTYYQDVPLRDDTLSDDQVSHV